VRPIVLYHPRGDPPTLPLSLVHLGSLFHDRRVAIVDARVELAPEAQVVALCREAACLGVTVRTGAPLRDALRISRAARAANPGLAVIWGGWHPSLLPGQCLASGAVDACVVGQGEGAFAAAARALEARASLSTVPGLVWRRAEGEVVENGAGSFADLNGLPRADFELLDLERYFRACGARRLDYCSSQTQLLPRPGEGEPAWSGLGAERVLEEVRELAQRHKAAEVCFRDEDFFRDPARLEAIGQGLAERGGRLAWSGAGSVDSLGRLTDDQLGLLRAGGCRGVGLRWEAGPPAQAGKERGEVLGIAERLSRAGLLARVSFLAGDPREPRERLRQVYRMAKAIREINGAFETPIFLYAPYPAPRGEPGPGPLPSSLEEWSEIDGDSGPWSGKATGRRVARYNFYLGRAYRPPGRRWGKRLVHGLARVRVWLGFFALDLERRAVHWAAEARTGRHRPRPPLADD
jgi:hypothetical protein